MSRLPDYVASAQPNPKENRSGWLMTTAATYAGVMLWFVFWQEVPMGAMGVAGGTLSQGLLLAIGALVLAAFLCHFLFYLAPGMLGMKTGLPLAVVGTSTYGVTGGFLMPGLLMGLLQFGWLSVNAYFSGLLLVGIGGFPEGSAVHLGVATAWALVAMFMGIMGIQYVGKIASFMPIIPIVILVMLLAKTAGTVNDFKVNKLMTAASEKKVAAEETLASFPDPGSLTGEKLAEYNTAKVWADSRPATLYGKSLPLEYAGLLGVVSLICTYVIGFFATAGAAGVNFGCGNKDANAVRMGGLVGIVLSTAVTGVIALVVVAGAQKMALDAGQPELLTTYNVTQLFTLILGKGTGDICMFLLAVAAFPSACFCTFIAAGCIQTSFPKVNPWISGGIGCAAAIALVIFGYAKDAPAVFGVIGASFGPICGAMTADYLLAGKKWAGPRAGFNPAGWLSWLFGFIVGGIGMVYPVIFKAPLPFEIPCPPLSAFIVGFVLYFVFAKMGLQSKVLDMPQRIDLETEPVAAE